MNTFFVMKRLYLTMPIKSDGLYVERFKERVIKINEICNDIKGIVAVTGQCFYSNDSDRDFNDFVEGFDYDEKQMKISFLCTEECYFSPQKIRIYFLTDNSALQSPFLQKADFNSLNELAYYEGIDVKAMRIIWKDKDFDVPIDKTIEINGDNCILRPILDFQRLIDIKDW